MVDCHEMFRYLYQMPEDVLRSLFGYGRIDYIIVNYDAKEIAWMIHRYNKKNLPAIGDIIYQEPEEEYLGCVTRISDTDNKAYVLWQDGSGSLERIYSLKKTDRSVASGLKKILTEMEGMADDIDG